MKENPHPPIRIMGVPMDLGASRRGVDMGPYALRVAGLNEGLRRMGFSVKDEGNVPVLIPEQMDCGNPRARFLAPISEVCEQLCQWVEDATDQGTFSIVLGGDHSISIGSLAGLAASYQKRGESLGLIWVDAHADFNTPETTHSGNIHGMALAATMGLGPRELTEIGHRIGKFDPSKVIHVGGRDIESRERALLKEVGIRAYTMRDIDERGMAAVMGEVLEQVTQETSGFAVSFDMDGCDPAWATGVGTPVPGGLSYREAHLAMEMIADTRKLLHFDLVEINPLLDHANQTSLAGMELVLSAVGKQIL